MDRREIKTRQAIRNAFLALRAHKPLERITVRELADRADQQGHLLPALPRHL